MSPRRKSHSTILWIALLFAFLVGTTLATEEAIDAHGETTDQHEPALDVREELIGDDYHGIVNGTNSSFMDGSGGSHGSVEEHYLEPGVAVLFPWFTACIGIFVYFVLSRFAPWLPYTAVMFTIGTIIAVSVISLNQHNLLTESIVGYWINIDGEVLLLVFLPGLLMKDAVSLNVHLFKKAFWQCFLFAFPMVLAGTTLTALHAYYLLPYGWSFDFCMMFGSILAATDPVAVAALLEQVGAPPRLMVHISGEALLNDGSAIVFFTIFYERVLYELGAEGSKPIGWGEGFLKFFRMSLGGACVGVFFGIGLLGIMHLLKRRLSREENIVEVTAILTVAYLCYFTADFVWKTSGVIATVSLGVFTAALGYPSINDYKLAEDFFVLLEHLLNTVLFTLGGLVWGRSITNYPGDHIFFRGIDWGYLILTFVMAMLIRAVLFGLFYPITVNLGLKTNVRETLFQVWGGLRGAVGIALAIFIDSLIQRTTEPGDPLRAQTDQLFAIVGGVAFMTLIINAPTAGVLIKKMGLADSGEVRRSIIEAIKNHWRIAGIEHMVRLLAQRRFHNVNFEIVKKHVHCLSDVTADELHDVVMRYHEENKHSPTYYPPCLENILPCLEGGNKGPSKAETDDATDEDRSCLTEDLKEEVKSIRVQQEETIKRRPSRRTTVTRSPKTLMETRRIFIEALRASYEKQLSCGELAHRTVLVTLMFQSLDLALDDVLRGQPLNDWEHSKISVASVFGTYIARTPFIVQIKKHFQKSFPSAMSTANRFAVDRCLCFLEAHKKARHILREEFLVGGDQALTQAEYQVLMESKSECSKAVALLQSFPHEEVEVAVSLKFCTIILTSAAHRVEHLVESGLLKEIEAEEFFEAIQEQLLQIATSVESYETTGHTDKEADEECAVEGSSKALEPGQSKFITVAEMELEDSTVPRNNESSFYRGPSLASFHH